MSPVTPEHLLSRLEAIGASVASDPDGLALLGLGSVGRERERLDEWSDLDFFVLVREGSKGRWLEDIGWLTRLAPVTFAFQNTADGYKLLYDDGVLCEFAVFEPQEMPGVTFAPGVVVWARDGVDHALLAPAPGKDGVAPASEPGSPPAVDVAWEVGEALTNLWVGLARFHRGERLTAARFVQGHAVDRVLALATALGAGSTADGARPPAADPFSPERRAEDRLPTLREVLPTMVQGYDRTPESAAAVLAWLEANVEVPEGMAAAVAELCQPRQASSPAPHTS